MKINISTRYRAFYLRHHWPILPAWKVYVKPLTCESMGLNMWLYEWPGQCYFYPKRDCPGWEPGGKCGRNETQIPKPIPWVARIALAAFLLLFLWMFWVVYVAW